jgi:hypothetical protein
MAFLMKLDMAAHGERRLLLNWRREEEKERGGWLKERWGWRR